MNLDKNNNKKVDTLEEVIDNNYIDPEVIEVLENNNKSIKEQIHIIEKVIETLKGDSNEGNKEENNNKIFLLIKKIEELKNNNKKIEDFESFINSIVKDKEENIEEDETWKEKASVFIASITSFFYSDKKNKEEETEKEFDEELDNVKLKDGILYSTNHLNVIKLGIKLEENNILILVPELGSNTKERILRYSKDKWFQVLNEKIGIKEIEVLKVKSLKR